MRSIEVVDGLPENARFVTGVYVVERDALGLVFESPDWPQTPEAVMLDTVQVEWRQEYEPLVTAVTAG